MKCHGCQWEGCEYRTSLKMSVVINEQPLTYPTVQTVYKKDSAQLPQLVVSELEVLSH